MAKMIRSYSELIILKTFEERFEYLKLNGKVGESTFGFNRYLNQRLYNSAEWKHFKNGIILRDHGCDLGVDDFDIVGAVTIHHINPLETSDLENFSEAIMDEENVISTIDRTHKAIHYGDISLLNTTPTIRFKNDTCPWRR